MRLGDLLSHQAGLVGWFPFYREPDLLPWQAWLERHGERCIVGESGTRAIYSDPGFLLLGTALIGITGDLDLASVFHRDVAGPTAVGEAGYGPVPRGISAASTEFCLWRNRVLTGEVFDENAAALGFPCGHAGLFATARGLAPWCREWLAAVHGRSRWLPREVALDFSTRRGVLPGSTWALGWDTRSDTGSSAGSLFSRTSFGSLGFPGASVWIDPVREGFAILLTNRIHPSRVGERIRQLRSRVHDEICRGWDGATASKGQ